MKKDDVLRYLATQPNGVTAKEAAADLGWTETSAATMLSRFYLYQWIDREPTGAGKGSNLPRYRYKPKLPKVIAPPAVDVEVGRVPQPGRVE